MEAEASEGGNSGKRSRSDGCQTTACASEETQTRTLAPRLHINSSTAGQVGNAAIQVRPETASGVELLALSLGLPVSEVVDRAVRLFAQAQVLSRPQDTAAAADVAPGLSTGPCPPRSQDGLPVILHGWSQLPEAILSQLCRFIQGKHAATSRLVCRQWAQQVLQGLTEIVLPELPDEDQVRKVPSVKTLSVNSRLYNPRGEFTGGGIWRADSLRQLKHLQFLDLSDAKGTDTLYMKSGSNFVRLAKALPPMLQRLSITLTCTWGVSQEELIRFVEGLMQMPRLEELEVQCRCPWRSLMDRVPDCKFLLDAFRLAPPVYFLPCLSKLTLDGVTKQASASGFDCLLCLPALTDLRLTGADFTGDMSLQSLVSLTSLELQGKQPSAPLGAPPTAAVARSNLKALWCIPGLRRLSLANTQVGDDDLRALRKLKVLDTLVLCDNHNITNQGISGLAPLAPSLTSLSITNQPLVNDLNSVAINFLSLAALDVSNQAGIAAQSLSCLITIRHTLTSLDLSHTGGIRLEDLVVLQVLPNLRRLGLNQAFEDLAFECVTGPFTAWPHLEGLGKTLTRLEDLDLRNNWYVSLEDLPALLPLRGLVALRLSGTRALDSQVPELCDPGEHWDIRTEARQWWAVLPLLEKDPDYCKEFGHLYKNPVLLRHYTPETTCS